MSIIIPVIKFIIFILVVKNLINNWAFSKDKKEIISNGKLIPNPKKKNVRKFSK